MINISINTCALPASAQAVWTLVCWQAVPGFHAESQSCMSSSWSLFYSQWLSDTGQHSPILASVSHSIPSFWNSSTSSFNTSFLTLNESLRGTNSHDLFYLKKFIFYSWVRVQSEISTGIFVMFPSPCEGAPHCPALSCDCPPVCYLLSLLSDFLPLW